MILLIDDVRDLPCDAIARTPSAARVLLAVGGWNKLLLDHDLGTAETGYTLLCWALEIGFVPHSVVLVTANSVGRQNMAAALVNAGYRERNPTWFTKE